MASINRKEARLSHDLTVQALALCVAEGVPVVLWGPPGTGKTSTINTISRAHKMHLETVIASIREPSDFFGLPYFENGFTRTAAPVWVGNVLDAKQKGMDSIVFYDEISTAPPATQAALLRPILEGYVGDTKLPDTTRTVAAANPPDIAADGWELSPPAANRFVHLTWEPSASDISDGFINGWKTARIPVTGSPEERRAAIKKARVTIGTFIKRNPKYATKLPDDSNLSSDFDAYNYAFPTPRSWEMAARLYASAMTSYIPLPNGEKRGVPLSVFLTLLNGCVGVDAAGEFIPFMKSLDLADPETVIGSPESAAIPSRGDQLQALLSALDAYVDYSNHEQYEAYGVFLARLIENGKGDAASTALNLWLAKKPDNYNWSPKIQHALTSFTKKVRNLS